MRWMLSGCSNKEGNMSNNFVLTKNGLVQMTRLIVSCRPIMSGVSVPENEKYLIALTKSGKDLDLSELKSGLPKNTPAYKLFFDQLEEFVAKQDVRVIGEEEIWKFFGGESHIRSISGQIDFHNLKGVFAKKILFAHILLPVEVTATEPCIVARYRNGEMEVEVSNLVSLISGMDVKVGESYLVHYASIVAGGFSDKIKQYLLEAQAESRRFVEDCVSVKKIDYGKFWKLCEWTQDVIKERGLML